jgi:TrmH family RNA methyltransferase
MTELKLQHKLKLSIVLVRPIYPRNIGMCARALANMGGGDVICIAPQCDLDNQMKEGAAGAQVQLAKLKVYECLGAFFEAEPDGLRLAMSARDLRSAPAKYFDDQVKEISMRPTLEFDQVYLIFGPEDHGLAIADLDLVHHTCRLPTFGEFTSLNLSHAVLLATYIFSSHFKTRVAHNAEPASEIQQRRPALFPAQSIHTWLEALGFNLDHKYVSAEKTLNRILLENEPTYEELKVLESILQQTIRKLKTKV